MKIIIKNIHFLAKSINDNNPKLLKEQSLYPDWDYYYNRILPDLEIMDKDIRYNHLVLHLYKNCLTELEEAKIKSLIQYADQEQKDFKIFIEDLDEKK